MFILENRIKLMLSYLQHRIEQLFEKAIKDISTMEEKAKVKMVLQSLFQGIVGTFILMLFVLESSLYVIIYSIYISLLFFCVFLIYQNKFTWVRFNLYYVSLVYLFILSILSQGQLLIEYFIIASIIITYADFQVEKAQIKPLIIGLIFFTIAQLINHYGIVHYPLPQNKEILYYVYLSMSVSLILGTIMKLRTEIYKFKDYIERKNGELEKANTELHKTNEELDRFVYSVSHDLRAPITSVMGLVDLCGTDRENIDLYLGLQRKSMNKLDNFIKDILNYARNSRLEVLHVVLDLPAIIKENFENQAYASAAEDMQFEIKVQGTSPLYGDAFRLNIIFANIISNAIRYRNPKANPSFLHFEVDLQPDVTKMTIADNGIGIPAEHLTNIFQMFYRANARVSGSGLGLYIVKEALNKMKGQIEVQSEEGKGTIFAITIPNSQN